MCRNILPRLELDSKYKLSTHFIYIRIGTRMKQALIFTFTLLLCNACQQKTDRQEAQVAKTVEYQSISTADYELEKPNTTPQAVLVLFGGYPEVAADIKREFKILEEAKAKEVAVVFSNYNRKLWFEEGELEALSEQVQKMFEEHHLPTEQVYFGGFSSGGNVALLLGNYLVGNETSKVKPKGIFIVDSPIDLSALYFSSEKNIKRNISETSVQESNWLIATLGKRFGHPNEQLAQYEKHAVFTFKTGKIDHLQNLKETKIRLYTEPDTLWWKENRMADYDQMNAYYIKALSEKLNTSGFTDVAYMPTENRGYRANGTRHPHSWSIVKVDELLNWILSK